MIPMGPAAGSDSAVLSLVDVGAAVIARRPALPRSPSHGRGASPFFARPPPTRDVRCHRRGDDTWPTTSPTALTVKEATALAATGRDRFHRRRLRPLGPGRSDPDPAL